MNVSGFFNWIFPDTVEEYRKQRAITESICADAKRRAEQAARDLAEFDALMKQTAPEDRARVTMAWHARRRERSQDVPADQEHEQQKR